eukprot:CAMPEP_0184686348 /NCGR_PEP_ID=MMETSP0312-20130426/22114_1 /TAXON_ID=31354 /ORGANISM="Compsopogon coeruleus, Strain SAG 36.94" /LENGTH=419 /DNA_ID=CAMNT_0027141335 /DNA_START=1 /DNA_END=1260 /DNA_ORIENTATION=-
MTDIGTNRQLSLVTNSTALSVITVICEIIILRSLEFVIHRLIRSGGSGKRGTLLVNRYALIVMYEEALNPFRWWSWYRGSRRTAEDPGKAGRIVTRRALLMVSLAVLVLGVELGMVFLILPYSRWVLAPDLVMRFQLTNESSMNGDRIASGGCIWHRLEGRGFQFTSVTGTCAEETFGNVSYPYAGENVVLSIEKRISGSRVELLADSGNQLDFTVIKHFMITSTDGQLDVELFGSLSLDEASNAYNQELRKLLSDQGCSLSEIQVSSVVLSGCRQLRSVDIAAIVAQYVHPVNEPGKLGVLQTDSVTGVQTINVTAVNDYRVGQYDVLWTTLVGFIAIAGGFWAVALIAECFMVDDMGEVLELLVLEKSGNSCQRRVTSSIGGSIHISSHQVMNEETDAVENHTSLVRGDPAVFECHH